MQPVLIYDIQSENMSQISQDHPKSSTFCSRELKQTEVTQKAQTKVIQVRSQQSQHSQISEKLIKAQEIEKSMIFLQQSIQREKLMGYNSETTRRLIKQGLEEVQFEWQYQAECQQQQQQQSLRRQNMQKAREKQIIEQKKIIQNKMIMLKANTDMFIKQIIPQNYKLTCFLSIQNNSIGLQSKYRLYLAEERQFLLSAKKEIFKYYSNYLISKHSAEIHRRSDNYIGHIDANFVGTDFQLYAVKGEYESLSLKIQYKKNIIGFNGPKSFKVIKSNPENNKYYNLSNLMQKKEYSKLISLETVQPSIKKGKYRLDFGGKAKIASSKNFILAREENNKEYINCLVFGKVKQNEFLMQISYPLSVFQAFGICLSSLDSKILVN